MLETQMKLLTNYLHMGLNARASHPPPECHLSYSLIQGLTHYNNKTTFFLSLSRTKHTLGVKMRQILSDKNMAELRST